MKRIFKTTVFACGLYATSWFCHMQTDGFALNKLSTFLVEEPSDPMDESPLTQRYLYHAKGGQSYVFISEDGQYVLKFLRGSRLNTLYFLNSLFPSKRMETKITQCEEKLDETIKSYQLAFIHLKEETGLVGLHVSSDSLATKKIKIVDKLKIEHTIRLCKYPFIVQKRALTVQEKIDDLMKKGDHQGAKKAINELISLIRMRREKGISDQDPNLCKNFGFIGTTAVQVDGGRFSKLGCDAETKLLQSKRDLGHWLKTYYPELAPYLDQTFQTQVLSSETL